MLDESKEKLLNKNSLFNLRKSKKEATAYEKSKNIWCVVAVFLSLVIIGLVYFLSNVSNIYHITIEGNVYLKDEDILELSGISEESKFLLVSPATIKRRIKENNLIDECNVTKENDRLVRISVKEKKVVGYALENGLYVLVMDNDERLALTGDNLYIVGKVPLLEGFNEEELILIEKNLGDCEYDVIARISEIHKYPDLKFQNIELIMEDGNYIFTSVYGFEILNKYYNIESSYYTGEKQCYYFEDISGNAYISACPWEEVEEEIPEEKIEIEDEDE